MAIPSLFDLTLPVLRLSAIGEVSYLEAADRIGDEFGIPTEERSELLASGAQTKLANRVRWAKVELGMAGLVENTKAGHFRATEQGRLALTANPTRIDRTFLTQFEEYRQALERSRRKAGQERGVVDAVNSVEGDPITTAESSVSRINSALVDEVLQRVVILPPAAFELLIIKLMLKMGYGGWGDQAGRHLGKAGDEGIDGVIDGDPLGLDAVYLQAKRYAPGSSVSRPELQAFVGSLIGRSATKGVFVTTASFSQPAKEFVRTVPYRIQLIDGERLSDLMIRYGVGVRVRRTLEIKELDETFFTTDLA